MRIRSIRGEYRKRRQVQEQAERRARMIYGYTRVSTEEQADGTSLATQRTMIQGVALASQLPTDITYLADPGVSGSVPFFSRPAVATLDIQPGDIIICSALDRFSRDARDCLNTIHELKELGVRLFLNGHGDVTDEGNVTARLMLEIMAAFAGHERRVIKERTTRGRRAKRERGGFIGGEAPWGCAIQGEGKDAIVVELPQRREALGKMRELRDAGKSYRDIAQLISTQYNLATSHMKVKRALDAESIAP